jgi:acyl transferase domain-containing protein
MTKLVFFMMVAMPTGPVPAAAQTPAMATEVSADDRFRIQDVLRSYVWANDSAHHWLRLVRKAQRSSSRRVLDRCQEILRYWVEPAAPGIRRTIAEANSKSIVFHDALCRLSDLAHLPGSHFWEIELSDQAFPYLRDHRIQGVIVVPGTVYLGIAQAGADECFGAGSYFLHDVEFHKALFLPQDGIRKAQLVFYPAIKGEYSFKIYSQPKCTEQNSTWFLHATGNIRFTEKTERGERRQ